MGRGYAAGNTPGSFGVSTDTSQWRVGLNLPAGATVTGTWNANRTGTSGAVQFSNVDHNGKIGAGQSTEFGFQAIGPSGGLTPACGAG